MNTMTDNVVPFAIPKKPRVFEKDPMPDQRKVSVLPIRAVYDKQLTHGMFKSLALICSYMNRSGITWVGQKTMADRLGISQQAISKHLVKLTKAGYLEILKKPMPGARHTTWRVIFDASISAQDAISITSAIEDTRPPYMKREQAMQAEQPDPEGLRRVAQAFRKGLAQPKKMEPIVDKPTDTAAVRQVKAAMKKAQARGTQIQPLGVVPRAQPQAQPQPVDNLIKIQLLDQKLTTSRGCTEQREHSIKVKNKVNNINTRLTLVLHNLEIEKLIEGGISEARIQEHLDILLPLYAAEGIKPSASILIAGIKQLQADAP